MADERLLTIARFFQHPRVLAIMVLAAIAALYYLISWSEGTPVLGRDHAAYLLMADHFSPFSNRHPDITGYVMGYVPFPPLYPILLGLLGATSAHVVWAHLVTASFLITAILLYFVWLRQQTHQPLVALLIAALFALLPGSLAQTLGLMSEGLYLALTLCVLILVETPLFLRHWYVVALLLGLVLVTRTVGVALLLALAAHMFWHRFDKRWHVVALSVVPLLLWFFLQRWMGYGADYAGSFTRILERQSLMEFALNQLRIESHALWAAWLSSFDPLPSTMTMIFGSMLGLLCLGGVVHRILHKKLDGSYVAVYLLIVLCWPYSLEAERFLYVVMPLLLYQGYVLICRLQKYASMYLSRLCQASYFVLIGLLAFAGSGTFLHRVVLAQEPAHKRYAGFLDWYRAHNLATAKANMDLRLKVIESWKKVAAYVPLSDCIYHVDPASLMLYADRVSYFAPLVADRESYWRLATQCRYHFAGSYIHVPYKELYYPANFLEGRAQPVFVDRLEELEGRPVLGMLLKTIETKQ